MATTSLGTARIRDAVDVDLAAVVAVLRAANVQFEPVLPPALYRAYLTNVLDVRSRLQDAQLLVAEREDRIVGAITLYPDASREGWGWPADWAGIRAVAVAPEARGLGIGRQLAQACIDRARALGARAVCLHTASFMAAAVVMYERVGFRRLPAFDSFVDALFAADGSAAPIPALAYRLDLEGGSARRSMGS